MSVHAGCLHCAAWDLPVPPFVRKLTQLVVSKLSDDLLVARERRKSRRSPLAGHCYSSAEAIYHLLGGQFSGWKSMNVRHEGSSHWFLRGPNGEILDPTAKQFETPVPYHEARGRGFLTREPSRRARTLIERVKRG